MTARQHLTEDAARIEHGEHGEHGERAQSAGRESPPAAGWTRRRSLGTIAVSASGAVAFTGCYPPERALRLQSRVRLAEDILTAYDDWYATTCRACDAGCGLIVRVVEGRAKKAEGNPDHPVNQGKLCARGQAVVQEQYHPDRIRHPQRRAGERGAGVFSPTTWDRAVEEVASNLRLLRDQGRGGQVVLVTPPLRGHQALVVERFTRTLGAQHLIFDPLPESPFREAARRVFGLDRLPVFDLRDAHYVLSFGADFLATWLSPVHYSIEYGIFRQGSYRAGEFAPRVGRPRGHLVYVSPHFSTTAANADEWLPVRPGGEGVLALSLAQVIVSEGLADPQRAAAFGNQQALMPYRPEAVAEQIGVPAARIRHVAREFATRGPSLAIGGGLAGAHTNGTDALTAVLALNVLAGATGSPGAPGALATDASPGGVHAAPAPPLPGLPEMGRASSLADWRSVAGRLRQGEIRAVLVYDANPVYGLPAALDFGAALRRAPLVASFSSFLDETAALADVILPSHLALEDWGDDVPISGTTTPALSLQQPVLRPFYDTRSFWDVLLAIASQLGGATSEALPWPAFKDVLRDGARELLAQAAPAQPAPDFERFWVGLQQRGGWWQDWRQPEAPLGTPPSPGDAAPAGQAIRPVQNPLPSLALARFAGGETDYPYHLVVFEHNTLRAGQGAHLPWLQAAPDPVTTAVWATWVEVNPREARRLGLREGDVVRVESVQGRVEVPVYVNPAAAPNVLAMPAGQGHTAYGRWAAGRGANPMALLVPLADEATGALAYAATRVRLTRTGRRIKLPKLEGEVPARQLPDEQVLKVTSQA